METAYPTSEETIKHKDKLRFVCELLVQSHGDATELVEHVAQVRVREIWEELNRGEMASVMGDDALHREFSLYLQFMETLLDAGKVSNVNPFLCEYPSYCGEFPLAEVLTNTKLAVINVDDMDENDPFNVKHSTADVILYLRRKKDKETCSKLVKALHSAQANLLALHMDIYLTEEVMEELAAYIDSLGPQPQLRYFYPGFGTTNPCSMLTSLSKCKQLRCLDIHSCDLGFRLHILLSDPLPPLRVLGLRNTKLCAEDVEQIADCVRHNKLPHLRELDIGGNNRLGSRLHILLSDPPPQLRVLGLHNTKLCAEDVEQIADCVRHNKLPHLRKLDIGGNRVGEEAVEGLLTAFLTIRRQSEQRRQEAELSDYVTRGSEQLIDDDVERFLSLLQETAAWGEDEATPPSSAYQEEEQEGLQARSTHGDTVSTSINGGFTLTETETDALLVLTYPVLYMHMSSFHC